MKTNPEIRMAETGLTEEVLNELIRMSEDWEKENSRPRCRRHMQGKSGFHRCRIYRSSDNRGSYFLFPRPQTCG